MTQRKPAGEKYLAKTITIRPDQAKDIEEWPTGQLSRICRAAIDQEIALDSLPDGLRDDALEAATAAFFAAWQIRGDYVVNGLNLDLLGANIDDMEHDAKSLDIPPDRLMVTLRDLFDLELEMQLRKRAILSEARA